MKKFEVELNLNFEGGLLTNIFEFEVEDRLTDEEVNTVIEEYWHDWIWEYYDEEIKTNPEWREIIKGGWKILNNEVQK